MSLVFQLSDTTLSINKSVLENHPILSKITDKVHIDMNMSDFLPILNQILSKQVENKDAFFNTCQYLGEIDLPILQSKNSELVQKWSLTPRLLVQCELEQFLLSIYTQLDSGLSFRHSYIKMFERYISNPMNNKLNEKSGGRVFKTLQTFHLDKELFDVTTDLLSIDEPKLNKEKVMENNEPFQLDFLLHELTDELFAQHHVPESDLSYPTISCANNWWRPLHPNSYSISGGLRKLKVKFDRFPFNVGKGKCVIAGGGVLRQIMTEDKNAFYRSDEDIFLITRDEEEATLMIHAIHNWVCSLNSEFFITRTKNSVTFTTTVGIFQVITRLYHDMVQLLSGFDLAPCCLLYDGKRILISNSGLDCIKVNKFHLLSWKQSETMAWRCKKMRFRRFSIMIPGLTEEEFERENNPDIVKRTSTSILKKIICGEGERGSDYDEIPYRKNSNEWIINKIRAGMMFGYAKQVQVLTLYINTVFDSEICPDDDFTVINGSEKNLIFVKEMAHKQSTGSFRPTSEDFFDGIKW